MIEFKYYPYEYYEDEIYNIMVKYIRKYLRDYNGNLAKNKVLSALKFLLIDTLRYGNLSSYDILFGDLLPSKDNGEYILCKLYETLIGLSYFGITNTMIANNYYEVYQINLDDEDILKLYLEFMNYIALICGINFKISDDDIKKEVMMLERVKSGEGADYRS